VNQSGLWRGPEDPADSARDLPRPPAESDRLRAASWGGSPIFRLPAVIWSVRRPRWFGYGESLPAWTPCESLPAWGPQTVFVMRSNPVCCDLENPPQDRHLTSASPYFALAEAQRYDRIQSVTLRDVSVPGACGHGRIRVPRFNHAPVAARPRDIPEAVSSSPNFSFRIM